MDGAKMAILASRSMVLEILPLQPEFDKGDEWIQTHFSFQVRASGQELTVKPSEGITILYEDLVALHDGIGQFVQRLQSLPEDSDPVVELIEPYEFVPLELDFEVSCLNGEISDKGEGEITMRIMVNLGIVNQAFYSEYVGCTTNVEAKSVFDFLDDLKREIHFALQTS